MATQNGYSERLVGWQLNNGYSQRLICMATQHGLLDGNSERLVKKRLLMTESTPAITQQFNFGNSASHNTAFAPGGFWNSMKHSAIFECGFANGTLW
jgi:hypothetical protein